MELAHRIQLRPTAPQEAYFRQAAGCARFTWNWAVANWTEDFEAGHAPTWSQLKKRFNAIKYEAFPWMREVHRDAHAQPFANLGKTAGQFFSDMKAGKNVHKPQFKKKGQCLDSFYVANDKFAVKGTHIKLPKIGWVDMTESLRFTGKILSATVSRTADRWFVSIQVDVPKGAAKRKRTSHPVEGMDLGVKAAVVLSTGEGIDSPRPLKKALRRLRIRQRRLSRKLEAAKREAKIEGKLPKGVKLPVSNNRRQDAAVLARLHARIANIRSDFTHKLTTRLVRKNQAIGIEDLCVQGMIKNHRLALALSDVGFGEIRRQLEYKSVLYGTTVVVADRFFPSSKRCSCCGYILPELSLSIREWTCPQCGTNHDRDVNAAQNLKRLATCSIGFANEPSALPVANQAATSDTGAGVRARPANGGKVTPVRYEAGLQGASGQEQNAAHYCTHFG